MSSGFEKPRLEESLVFNLKADKACDKLDTVKLIEKTCTIGRENKSNNATIKIQEQSNENVNIDVEESNEIIDTGKNWNTSDRKHN